MRLVSNLVLAALFTLVAFTTRAQANTASDDGCWSGKSEGRSCLVQARSSWKGDRYSVKYKNRCSKRIYVKVCHGIKGKSYWDCGSWGLDGGESKTWGTASANGKVVTKVIGSKYITKDHKCSYQVPGWNRSP